MSTPRVSVAYADGNLIPELANLDGLAALILSGEATEDLALNTPVQVSNLAAAEALGIVDADNSHAHRQIKEFYTELGGNQPLWIMLAANSESMADLLDFTNLEGAKKLLLATGGNISLLGISRVPDGGHTPGTDFIDAGVSPALTAANNLGIHQLGLLQPIRVLVGARVATEASSTILQVKDLDLPFAGAVLGSSAADNIPAVGLVLGRAVRFGAEIKLGKVANGPLSIAAGYIGTKEVQTMSNLPVVHGAGFISLMNHPGKGGLYFGIDRMATIGDYRILAHGRVIDKACRVAATTYANSIEGEVIITEAGQISDTDLAALKAEIEQAIQVAMGDQISGARSIIAADQNLINNPTLEVQLEIRPKGYTSFINVTLGLVAN